MIAVQIFIKKNTLVKTGAVGTANFSPYTQIKDSVGGFTTNQYVGHYIKITKGLGLGSIAYIVSNNTDTLTLQTGIQTDTTTRFEIYRTDYQKLDLYKAEKISVTSQIASASDIGKVFTDFTQSFTIPASDTNNQILSHWYESSIDNGFDHRVRYEGYIEINTQRFKDGNFQIEKASKKNGFIESYTLTFYGNLTQIKDIIQDDKLSVLDFSPFNHVWNETEVQNRIETASVSGDIKYPLIGNKRKYYYKDALHPTEDITLVAGAINWNELFPAILVSNIFLQIKAKYGIEFTGSFINEDQYKKLYLYLKPALEFSFLSEPKLVTYSTTNYPSTVLNIATGVLTIDYSANLYRAFNSTIFIVPEVGYETVNYVVKVYKNNVLYKTYQNLVGNTFQQVDATVNTDYVGARLEYYVTVQATAEFKFIGSLFSGYETIGSGPFAINFYNADSSVITVPANIQIGNYMPDMKIYDFLNGIVKAFNLMIIPKGNNIFDLMHLELYYNAGKITDITPYVYANEMDIERPKLYKSINLLYQTSTNIINNAFKTFWGTEYGNLIYKPVSSNENASYDITLPFENILFERTTGTQFLTATLIDKDLKPYIPKPMLIYCNGISTTPLAGADRIQFKKIIGYNLLVNYNRFSNEYDSFPTDVTHKGLMTMNFGNEQSPWYGVLAPQGLYYRHYRNYIENLYNIKTRIVKVKALFPPSVLTSNVKKGITQKAGIALNDRLIIRNKRYIINNMTIDLTSGEANLELITDYRGPDAASSIGYKFATQYEVETDKEAITFDTTIYLNDYDSFIVKGATNFLSYPVTLLDEYSDLLLPVTIPYNGGGVDRTDMIGIEYYKDGTLQVTENINVKQYG
jgi:hypothetical protein